MQAVLKREESDFIFDLYQYEQNSDEQAKQEHAMEPESQDGVSIRQIKDPSYLT